MLSLVEARLRRLIFGPVLLKFPSVKQMIWGHYLFSGGDKTSLSKVIHKRLIGPIQSLPWWPLVGEMLKPPSSTSLRGPLIDSLSTMYTSEDLPIWKNGS